MDGVAKKQPPVRKPSDFVYEYYWDWQFPMTPGTFAIERDRVKYIQYYGIYDTEELCDLSKDPDEMHNLIDDPAYLDRKVALRAALYKGLANRAGLYAIPFTARYAQGSVRRDRDGTGAAPFPDQWLVEPNRLDRLDDMVPDNPMTQRAHDEGRPFIPYPVMGGPRPADEAKERSDR